MNAPELAGSGTPRRPTRRAFLIGTALADLAVGAGAIGVEEVDVHNPAGS